MTIGDIRRLKTPESENRLLKQIVVEQAWDTQILKELLFKTYNARDEEIDGPLHGDLP